MPPTCSVISAHLNPLESIFTYLCPPTLPRTPEPTPGPDPWPDPGGKTTGLGPWPAVTTLSGLPAEHSHPP